MAAQKLMDSMNCSSSEKIANSSTQIKMNNFTAAQLSCSVGPLGKTVFGKYGNYYVKAYEDNPPKDCQTTYQYCKSRSKSIADGARIKPSERSKTPTSYTAHCNSRSSGLNTNL